MATLRELYNREKRKLTPAQAFIKRCAKVTNKSQHTVQMWLTGDREPDELTKQVLAKHLKVSPEELFKKGGEDEVRTL